MDSQLIESVCPKDGGRENVSIKRPDRLEKERSGAHIPRMERIVKCDCGAEYKRTEAKFLMPHTGHVSCEVCGVSLTALHFG